MSKHTIKASTHFKLLACSILALSVGAVADVPTPQGHELRVAVEGIFSDVNSAKSPGCSVGIQKGQKTLLTAGYGMSDIAAARQNTADTHFNIASMSKQFTVLSILTLQKDGKLSVDDDIRDYIPEVIKTDKAVKISHLIHHTSGLMDYVQYLFTAGMAEFEGLERDLAIEIMTGDYPTVFPAGSAFIYNNGAYVLLAEIVSRVSGQDFETYARENILSTVDMRSSYFRSKNDPNFGQVATPYMNSDDNAEQAGGSVNYSGDGGLVTTINDFLKYTAEIHKGKNLWNEKNRAFLTTSGRLTGPKKHPETGTLKTNYGGAIGLQETRGQTILRHGGSIDGFNTLFHIYPETDLTIVAFCNFDGAGLRDRFSKIGDLFFGEEETTVKASALTTKDPVTNNLPQKLVAALSGTFKSDMLKTTYNIAPLGEHGLTVTLKSPYSHGSVKTDFPDAILQPSDNSDNQLIMLDWVAIETPKKSVKTLQSFTLRTPSMPPIVFTRIK